MEDIERADLEGPKIDRRTTVKLLGAAGMTGLAGCTGGDGSSGGDGGDGGSGDGGSGDGSSGDGGSETDSPAASDASRGGSIEAGWAFDAVEMLDPHYVDVYQQITIFSNIFSGIVKINRDGEIVGDLAEDWTLPDETTYEFTLREGVTFHNGDTLDAEAAKWSIERLMSLEDSPHVGKVADIESVEAPDATTLRVNLQAPVAPFITFMTRGPGRAGTIVNRTAVEEDAERYRRFPVGSGPFELTDRSSGESLTLTAFDDYWETDEDGNSLPYLEEVTINLIPEPSTMWSALSTGGIHYADEVPPQNAKQSENMSGVDVSGFSSGEWSAIALLCNDPASDEWATRQSYASGNDEPTDRWEGEDIPTTDPQVRRAVALAIDREELVQKAYFGYAEPAHSLINPAIAWAYDEQPENAQVYDPERAEELLDEAGYTGDPRFTTRILGTPTDERVMTVIQQQLADVGIDVELNVQQESSYWDNIYLYNHMMAMYGGGGDIDPWMSWWKQLRTPMEEGSSGAWQKNVYSNEAFDEALSESYNTPNREERRQYVKEAEQIFLQDNPFAMTTFPLTPKGRVSALMNVGNQAGLSNFHRAYLEE
jgi:peptide/nickel transport system substrate-binding protein